MTLNQQEILNSLRKLKSLLLTNSISVENGSYWLAYFLLRADVKSSMQQLEISEEIAGIRKLLRS